MNNKERNISIDILKCLAAIFITNSHMDMLYVKFNSLATGGAIGDVLFFFCSGFTLFLGKIDRFDNWYKRRINRIYPTVFAWSIISAFFLGHNMSMDNIIIHGGGWFVSCIMIYYVIIYIIRVFFHNHLNIVFTISFLICLIWYYLLNRPDDYNMYGETYFKWGHYFLFMLMGAIIGNSQNRLKLNFKYDTIKLLFSILIYYYILYLSKINPLYNNLQIISLIPLLLIVYYLYKFCSNTTITQLYNMKILGFIIKLIGTLCLEIYLIQSTLFTNKLNFLFPLNIPIMFVIIIVGAYFLKCSSRLFAQTFNSCDYNWKDIYKL